MKFKKSGVTPKLDADKILSKLFREKCNAVISKLKAAEDGISEKTIRRNLENKWVPDTTIEKLARLLNIEQYILKQLLAKRPQLPIKQLVDEYKKIGDYEKSYELSQKQFKKTPSKNIVERVYWLAKMSSAKRMAGELKKALKCFVDAFQILEVDARFSSDQTEEIEYWRLIMRFQQIVLKDRLIEGRYQIAFSNQSALLIESKNLLRDSKNQKYRQEIESRIYHIKRQLAVMLQGMGRYHNSEIQLLEIRYPKKYYEERFYTLLARADNFRLSGNINKSARLLMRMKKIAEKKHSTRDQRVVIWRVAQNLMLFMEHKRAKLLMVNAEPLYKSAMASDSYSWFYFQFTKAISEFSHPTYGLKIILKLERQYGLRRTYMVAEYALVVLYKAVLALKHSRYKESEKMFTEAFDCFSGMGSRWGIVRSWIGLKLIREPSREISPEIISTLEGTDKVLFERSKKGEEIALNVLILSVP